MTEDDFPETITGQCEGCASDVAGELCVFVRNSKQELIAARYAFTCPLCGMEYEVERTDP